MEREGARAGKKASAIVWTVGLLGALALAAALLPTAAAHGSKEKPEDCYENIQEAVNPEGEGCGGCPSGHAGTHYYTFQGFTIDEKCSGSGGGTGSGITHITIKIGTLWDFLGIVPPFPL